MLALIHPMNAREFMHLIDPTGTHNFLGDNLTPEEFDQIVVEVPAKWQQPELPQTKGDLNKWWTSFNDKTLVTLIESAKKNIDLLKHKADW